MKTLLTCSLVCLALAVAGCDSTAPTGEKPGKDADAKKPGGGKPAAKRERVKGKNAFVGRWVFPKPGKQDWSDKVSKDAVIEFHDEDSPGTGKITVTDTKAKGEGYYLCQSGGGFVFQVKFYSKDGVSLGGYGGLLQVTKLTDDEIVGDLFTLKRVD
jgi:hypothetical protein